MPSSITIPAPAKINLFLSVTGRRPDGYHLLETLMLKIDLADEIKLSKSSSQLNVSVMGASLPAGEGNLVTKAAIAFFAESGIEPKIEIVLDKKIPVAAGLGGGSSDAASTLLGLNRLFDHPLSMDRLHHLGSKLGADVCFFLINESAALMKGIGDKLIEDYEIENKYMFLLINPGWSLSTTQVFKNYKLELTSSPKTHIYSFVNGRSFSISSDLHNDLETVVLPQYEEIRDMKARLLEQGAVSTLMSGSGPTVFGVFSSKQELEHAYKKIKAGDNGKWAYYTTRKFTLETTA